MASLTLAQTALLKSTPLVAGMIEANTRYTPEWGVIPVKSIEGTSYKTLVRTSLPNYNFQDLGAGVTPTASTFAIKERNMFFSKQPVQAIKEIADDWDRSNGGPGSYFGVEGRGVTKAAMQRMATQCWYGTGTTDKGFQGFKAFTPFGGAMTINAGGTSAGTASSVYLVWADADDEEAACFLTGNDTVFDLPEPMLQVVTVTNPDGSTGQARAYYSEMSGYSGLKIGSINCVVRICNLTAETGKGLTDNLIAQAKALFPAGYGPTHIFGSGRSQEQARISRSPGSITVLNNQGQPISAPPYTDHYGTPFIRTDSILNTDAIEA